MSDKMADFVSSVDGWLRSERGVSCKREWLEACLAWIQQEEGGLSQSLVTLQNSVYQQWVHTDLRESTTGCLPPELFNSQAGQITGNFIVQIDSIINVGKAAYSQLEQLKGQELEEVEPATRYNAHDLKPSRMLFISLTDGCGSVQGMEYQLIDQLSVDTPPGTKVLLQGSIQYRLGVLLLVRSHVTVLGGSVEELQIQNSEKRVLARALNNEALADNSKPNVEQSQTSCQSQQPEVPVLQNTNPQHDQHTHYLPAETHTLLAQLNTSSDRERTHPPQGQYLHSQETVSCSYQAPSQNDGPANNEPNQNLYTSFHEEDNSQGEGGFGVPDWAQFCDFGESDTNKTRHDNKITGTSTENYAIGTREGNVIGPSDITVLPVCGIFREIAGKPGRTVYTKASINKVEGELTRGTSDWSVEATIFDHTGELSVLIGNKPIEILTGFTLTEFKSRTLPTVQMRQGLLRCHKTLLSLNCVMEIQWHNRTPTITRLLDV